MLGMVTGTVGMLYDTGPCLQIAVASKIGTLIENVLSCPAQGMEWLSWRTVIFHYGINLRLKRMEISTKYKVKHKQTQDSNVYWHYQVEFMVNIPGNETKQTKVRQWDG